MKNISGIVLGVLVMVLTLIMMPMLLDANDDIIIHDNISLMTGLEAVAGVGPIIMLVGLLASGGLFTMAGFKGHGTAGRGDLFKVIGSIVALLIALIMFGIVVTSTADLYEAIVAAEGNINALSAIVCIIPLILYVGVIAGVGMVQYRAVRKVRKARRFIA